MNRLFEGIANDVVLSERWAEFGITRRKIFQYFCLFWFLLVIYSFCLSSYYKFLMAEPASGYGFGDVMKPLIGTCLVSALPFAALAYSDKTWALRRCRSSYSRRMGGSVYWPFVPI